MKLKILIATLGLLVSTQAKAWLLFEPFIGYNKGQEQGTTVQGIGLGTRLGFDLKDVFIAADIDYNDLQMGTLSSVKYTHTGVTLGGVLQTFRIWYGVITAAQLSYPSGTLTVTSKGSGTKIGLSAKASGKMNINLELRSINYTTNDPGTGVTTAISEVGTIGFLSFSWSI